MYTIIVTCINTIIFGKSYSLLLVLDVGASKTSTCFWTTWNITCSAVPVSIVTENWELSNNNYRPIEKKNWASINYAFNIGHKTLLFTYFVLTNKLAMSAGSSFDPNSTFVTIVEFATNISMSAFSVYKRIGAYITYTV